MLLFGFLSFLWIIFMNLVTDGDNSFSALYTCVHCFSIWCLQKLFVEDVADVDFQFSLSGRSIEIGIILNFP